LYPNFNLKQECQTDTKYARSIVVNAMEMTTFFEAGYSTWTPRIPFLDNSRAIIQEWGDFAGSRTWSRLGLGRYGQQPI